MDLASKAPIRVGEVTIDFLVDADDSGGSVTVFECEVPAGAKLLAPHSHDAFEETIYGLAGELTFTIDGHDHPITAGASVCIRRGQIHGFDNRGSADAKFLAIATPGVFGPAYFHEIGEILAAAAGGPPDLVALAEVMQRHGLTPAQRTAAAS
jgi:quercetin dioxygenase-like cupin family protein